MATGTHSLSLVTNSCRKSAINPETGLALTQNEIPKNRLNTTWHGFDGEFASAEQTKSKTVKSKTVEFTSDTNHSPSHSPTVNVNGHTFPVSDIKSDLSNLTDDEFYHKLIELKEAHKKTLKLCESIYKQKLSGSADIRLDSNQVVDADTTKLKSTQGPLVTVNKEFVLTAETPPKLAKPSGSGISKEFKDTFNSNLDALRKSYHGPGDMVRDMSASKPPRPKTASARMSTPQKKVRLQDEAQVAQSMDDNFWRARASDSEHSEDESNVRSSPKRALHGSIDYSNTRSAAISRIQDMWDEFAIDDYAPRSRQRSSSLSRIERCSSARDKYDEKKSKEWRHRVTIPKPFNMTIREAMKAEEKRKSKAIEELEAERLEREKQEELELQKKFKAKPVPSHVYMPLYDEIMEEKESRKRYIHNNRAQLLKSQEKPFKFTKKENKMKAHLMHHQRTSSAPAEKCQTTKKEFKAKPYPSHIFNNNVMDKMQEEEEYRKIRMKMRSEELLKTSTLPPNMKARGQDYVEGKSRQKMYAERARKAGLTNEHKFKPRVNQDMPDFEELHKQFSKEMERRKYSKEATVVKPFSLRTEKIPSKKSKVYEDIEKDESTLKEYRWPYMTPRRRIGGGSLSG